MEEMLAGGVFYPDMDVSGETSRLAVARAESYNFLPPMYGASWSAPPRSVRKSDHGPKISGLSHLISKIKLHKSPHTRLNPEPAHSREPQGPTLTFVKPEFISQPSETLYRLQCPHAGVFQCRLTGLVFQMEGEGEVHYRTVQWEEGQLHSTGQTSAGPLFNIICPQGSVCQLHLPHCEIPSGEGLKSLSVAHVSGDNVEILPPLRVTDTHVVVNITDLSLWGLVRRFIPFLTIRGQVLAFHKLVNPQRPRLNLIVLPQNVPLQEVERMQRESSYIDVCSDCTLSRGEVYSLCCDVEGYKIQPKRVQVHWNYGPNYHPTFQVFLSTDTEEVELRLLERGGKGEQVWAACVPLTGSSSARQTEHAQKGSAEEQLRSTRPEFVERVTMPVLDDLLDELLQERVINDAEMEAVKVEAVRKDRARATIDMVLKKGSLSCFVMKTMLAKYDPTLYTTLGFQ
ncbi:NACHT, LRR and PYD domains-containing protein 1a-like isoform X1 [Osmerus eperlanus]|uniref:NACHT, LRR and PYD domains-containing protein 1a-like isoform X1 n=2 Tax=Osmerus eperlanus TaxID=29151 RepID=UPI002E0F7E1E